MTQVSQLINMDPGVILPLVIQIYVLSAELWWSRILGKVVVLSDWTPWFVAECERIIFVCGEQFITPIIQLYNNYLSYNIAIKYV